MATPISNLLPQVPNSSLTRQGFMQANNSGAIKGILPAPNLSKPVIPPNGNDGGNNLPPNPANPGSAIKYNPNNPFNLNPDGTPMAGTGNNPQLPMRPNSESAPPLTTAGLVPGLINAATNNPTVDKIAQQEQVQLGDTLTGQPGQPLDLAQGRAGLIQNTANAAIANALKEQELKQSGLSSAISATAPITGVPYGTQTIQPGLMGMGGNNENGGALNPINNIQSIAKQVIDGQLSPQQGYALGGNVSNFQGALNAEIQKQKPGFDTAGAQGRYDANQANTQTRGVTPTNAAASAYSQNYPLQLQVQGQIQNVQNLGQLLIDTAGKEINPLDLKYGNQLINQFKTQLSQDQQVRFNQSLATYAGALSGLLANSNSVTPTQITQWTQGILDGSLKMSALKASYDQALKEGNIKLQSAQSLTNIPGQTIGAPKVGSNSNPLGI